MGFWTPYLWALAGVSTCVTLLWLLSIPLKNVSIIDLFWGAGFVLCAGVYGSHLEQWGPREILVMTLVALWGLRLSLYLTWRNWGHPEDFRYRKFREDFGAERYWWYSFPTVFLLQGVLMWLISAPLLGSMRGESTALNAFDAVAIALWAVGIFFEAGADLQLARFKSDPNNQGKLLTTGFWRYTRHPNYFGDSCVWWGYGVFSIAAGHALAALGSVLMTALIIKVSGVALLEGTMKEKKPGYEEYARRTSAFVPWIPKAP